MQIPNYIQKFGTQDQKSRAYRSRSDKWRCGERGDNTLVKEPTTDQFQVLNAGVQAFLKQHHAVSWNKLQRELRSERLSWGARKDPERRDPARE